MTAFALIGLSVLGVIMWLKRKPSGKLGAPTGSSVPHGPGLIIVVVLLGLLLPLFGLSLLAILVLERVVGRFGKLRSKRVR